MTDQQKAQIQADAERAAQERQTPNVACNHPFSSEQGRYWVACYQAEWDRLYSRSYDEGQGLGGCGFETFKDRRGN